MLNGLKSVTGSPRLVRSAGDEDTGLYFLGAGKMLSVAVESAERLASQGVSTTVWDPRLIQSPDQDMIKTAAEHSLVVTMRMVSPR